MSSPKMSGYSEAILASLKNKHRGQRCFIMGNGPSLNLMDLSLFEDEIVFGLNACYLLFPRIKWHPTYWTCVDTRVLPDQADKFIAMHKECPNLKMFIPDVLPELTQDGIKTTVTTDVIPEGPNRYYFHRDGIRQPFPSGTFSTDISRRVVAGKTVAIAALQIAFYMGFNPIYLIGCDTDYVIPESVRQYGPDVLASPPDSKINVRTQYYLEGLADDDPNHFDPSYFGKGRKYHVPNVEKMIWHYEQAKAVLDPLGVEVINATVGGKLEVFPRVDYKTLF